MGACDHSDEPAGGSQQMLVSNGAEELGIGSLGERMGDCIVEPVLGLDNGSGASPRDGYGLVLQSVSEEHCYLDSGHRLGPLEDEDLNAVDGCQKPDDGDSITQGMGDFDSGHADVGPELGNMSGIKVGLNRICFDETQCRSELSPCGSNQTGCSSEWVEPLSNADCGSGTLPRGRANFVPQSISEDHSCSDSEGGLGPLQIEGRHTMDGFSAPSDGVTNLEVTTNFGDGYADASHESSIEIGISKIYFDETQCKNEMIPCPGNRIYHSGEHNLPSKLQDVGCLTAENESDSTVGGDNPSVETLVEVFPNMTFIGDAVDDGYSKSTPISNGLLRNCSAAVNFTHSFGGSDHVEKQSEGNGRTDDDIVKIDFPDASSSSLRRSSRTRKCLQKVQGGKHPTKCSKKASNLSHCGTIDLLSKATRKKRSCLSRSLCPSGWGLPWNLSKYFDCSNEGASNQVLDKGSKRGKAGQRNKKKKMLKVVASSQISDGIQGFPCRPIRLKVTFGKKVEQKKVEVMPSEAVDAQAARQSSDEGNKPDLCLYMEKTVGESIFPYQKKTVGESTCPDTVQLEPHKLVSSQADKYTDPGTSPDSEVIDQVVDSNIVQSTLTVLHNPANIMSDGTAVPGDASFSFPSKESKKKRNKKDKRREASNVGIEDTMICQAGVDKAKKKQRNKKDKLCEASNLRTEDRVLCQAGIDRAKSKKGGRQRISRGFCSKDSGVVAPNEIPRSNIFGNELILMEPLSVSDKITSKAPSLDDGADSNASSHMVAGVEPTDSENLCLSVSPDGAQEKRILEGPKAKGKSRNEAKVTDTTKKQREPSGQWKGNKRKGVRKAKMGENDSSDQAYHKKSQSPTGKYDMLDARQSETGNGVVPGNVSCLDNLHAEGGKRILPPRIAWVCCDDCNKWRCISAKLADIIEETHCRWTCKDNQDQAFADCSIPQEKSNAEINAELQISDEEDGRDGNLGSKGGGIRHAIASQPSTWMLIKSNLFLHRSRKTQTMDEIMVCHCKPPVDDGLGCGSQCLNRMLNIECVQGTCPCGDLCSNQQFQKQHYAKLNWFRCGKKGYGLQASEDISKGQFLIEYVGEVLDLQSYEARQKEYASKGYKHFYFMTLNGNEVIDACAKGNLGRFVNHSCDPNCRTEKWVVNGEICVGLFALRKIRKGEELTFDYNYVRVFGAAAKKCHCGSHKCRGYIGGDPHNAEVIVQGDSDEEFPEPIVIDENGEINHTLEDVTAKSRSEDVELVPHAHDLRQENLEVRMEDGDKVNEIQVGGQSPALTKMQESDEVNESSENLAALQTEHVRDDTISPVDQLRLAREHTTSTSLLVSDVLPVKRTVKNSLSGSSDSTGRISEVEIVECEQSPSKRRPRTKISRPSKSVKDRKSNSNSSGAEKVLVTGHRTQLLSYKPRKLLGSSANGHLEAVEEKLNELLDTDGGICKRKDASKGYLKLLLLTAASGDSGNGGAIQSNRDLSMILDAMLKTKSRGVLLDIINKNGLQMLHNMMKLYRRDFKKIPILRKLLKVLEFLAEREILTSERINGDPLCPGVESFRESILCLTEHEDKKVHQIARNFRDRWIPRPIRKFNGMEKPDRKREFNKNSNSNRFFGIHHRRREHVIRRTEAIDCVKQSELSSNPSDAQIQKASSPHLSATQTIVSRPRKRKSRWDQDKEPKTSPQKMKTSPVAEKIVGVLNQRDEAREEKSFSVSSQNFPEPSIKADDPMQTSEDDAPPPGFSSPHICEEDAPPGFSSLQSSEDAPPGFSSLLPQNSPDLKCPSAVFKGYLQERFNSCLPVSYGIPFSIIQQLGTLQSETTDSWVIAPAIPFQPYPPLPSYPRNKSVVANRGQEEIRRDQGIPSTSGVVQPNAHNLRPANQPMVYQARGFPNGPGRRYHRQQKWNNHPKWRRPWFRRRNGWGFKGNHPRNGMFVGMAANGQNGQHLIDVNHSVEFAGNSC